MARVKSEHTGPERLVAKALTSLGYRYRLHRADIPGKPDFAFIGRRKLIFVHGCFWHGHSCKRGNRMPATNVAYWSAKIARNRARDAANAGKLIEQGWAVLTLWECELQAPQLAQRLDAFLNV